LLVEDNPDDIALTLRAFKKSNIHNQVITIEDGQEVLDYFLCKGKFEGKDPRDLPSVVLFVVPSGYSRT
jgi:two-component system, response regulator